MTGPTNGKQLETIVGTVGRINSKGNGIQLDGNPEYLNVSQYHPIALPLVGARVQVEVERTDRGAWIVQLRVLDNGPGHAAVTETRSDRDATITRLAVLKAAAHFLGLMSQCREEVRSDHVLVLADKWLAWVEQA
jgi:hypothetical protein